MDTVGMQGSHNSSLEVLPQILSNSYAQEQARIDTSLEMCIYHPL